MKKFLLFVVILTCGISALHACKKKEVDEGKIVARVNKKVLTTDDVAISMNMIYPPEQRNILATPEGKRKFLQELIIIELFSQEAIAQGIDQDPRFKQVMENYKRYLLYNTLVTRGVTETAMEDFFRSNFIHAGIIFLAKPKNANEKQIEQLKAKAQNIRDQIAKGADFGTMAKKFSQHKSASAGGDIGIITRSKEWEPEMLDSAFALTEKENLSPVVESASGFYIIKLFEPAGKIDMKYLTPEIKRAIYYHLLSQNYAIYAAQLQTQAEISVNEALLNTISIEQGTGPQGSKVQPLTPDGVPGVDSIAR